MPILEWDGSQVGTISIHAELTEVSPSREVKPYDGVRMLFMTDLAVTNGTMTVDVYGNTGSLEFGGCYGSRFFAVGVSPA